MKNWPRRAVHVRKHIVLVDDSPADLELAQHAFRAAGLAPAQLHTLQSGDDLLAALRAWPVGSDPSLILLDLNMSGLSGVQTLLALRREPRYAMTPVVMLTTSRENVDLERCYRSGANGYVVKPSGLPGFLDVARALRAFWLDANEVYLPPAASTVFVEPR